MMPDWWSLSEVASHVAAATGKDEASSREETLSRLKCGELTARAERAFYNPKYPLEYVNVPKGFWLSCKIAWENDSAEYIGSGQHYGPLGESKHYRCLEGITILGLGVERLWPTAPPEIGASDKLGEQALPLNKGGRPKDHDGEAFLIEAFRIIYEGNPMPTRQAHLVELALEAYSAKRPAGEEPPGLTWAKDKVRKLWKALDLG